MVVKKKKKIAKNKGGRPTKMTPEALGKLEQVFAIDGTVEEALSYAEIKKDVYYEYLKRNPKFAERIENLRQKPVLKARQAVVASLSDPNQAFKYLEKKRRKEFGNAIEIDNPTQNNQLRELNQKLEDLFKDVKHSGKPT